MKNFFKVITLLLCTLTVFISCNDGSEGLIQEAMNAEYSEKIKLINIVGRSADKLYAATDKGIYSIDSNGQFSTTSLYGNGNIAKRVLFYDGENVVLANTDDTYSIINLETGDKEEITKLAGYTYKGMYSPDGKSFTYLFSNDNKYYKISSMLEASSVPTEIAPSLVGYSASIIGQDAFRLEHEKTYYYSNNGTLSAKSSELFVGMQGDIRVLTNGDFYNGTTKYSVSNNVTKATQVAIANDGSIYIYPYSNVYIDTSKTENHASASIKGLSSLNVYSIIKSSSSNDYLLITHSNGLYILSGSSIQSLKDKSGIDYSNYIY